ncbi:hypothetical protein XF30_00730 [Bradyrhizobium sp. SUTN9-2]|nr:hypothetical protein XF30_00730 [Bradyrhizobium sp. SUTN9-2]
MPLIVKRAAAPTRWPQPGTRSAQIFVQITILIKAPTLVPARGIDHLSDVKGGVGGCPSLQAGGLPYLLITRGKDFLAQRLEQAGQIASRMPACHHLLQFR